MAERGAARSQISAFARLMTTPLRIISGSIFLAVPEQRTEGVDWGQSTLPSVGRASRASRASQTFTTKGSAARALASK